MQGFSSESKVSLDNLVGAVTSEITRSNFTKKAETKRTRMAWYLGFCKEHQIPDPWGKEHRYLSLIALYAKALISGLHIQHRMIRAATVRLYMEVVNELFRKQT